MSKVVPLNAKDRVLPADLDAEAAVLSAVILSGDALDAVRGAIEPRHFSTDANRLVFGAVLELAMQGKPVDSITVATLLRDRGQLDRVGGSPYLAKLIDATPAVAHVEEHAQTVIEKAHLRNAIATFEATAVELRNGATTLEDARRRVSELEALTRGDEIERLDAQAIFEPLPPVPWIVQSLDLCPGAPALFAGYGYSGKTVAIQSLATSIASGLPIWGTLGAAQGKVLHLDYEQGSRLTRDRYQRLAIGLTIGPQDLQGRLELACFPRFFLDEPRAEDVLARALDGFTLCIIDSFRAAAPSIEENSSEARRPLDVLARVSERTGCAVIVIHHARKPQKDSAGGPRMAIRGSGAIFDACSSVLVFEGSKGEPTNVYHEKARNSGIEAENFRLAIDDVPMGRCPTAGLIVTMSSVPRVAVPGSGEVAAANDLKVLEFILGNPGSNVRAIRAGVVGLRESDIDKSVERLVLTRRIERRPGVRNAVLHYPLGGAD